MKIEKRSIIGAAIVCTTAIGLGVLLSRSGGMGSLRQVSIARFVPGNTNLPLAGSGMAIPAAHVGKMQLFILAGQSNMAGLGELPLSELPTHRQIYVFGNDYRWKLAKEPVDDPTNQVDRVSVDLDAGFGPSVSFATTLLQQKPDQVIGLIPCAKGGSSIAEWRRHMSDQTLYGSCLKRVRAAAGMGTVVGLLYFQGEIDTIDPKEQPNKILLPDRWAEEFAVLVKNWRQDLGLPQLPVVFAQIGTNTEPQRFKNWAVVKKQQRQVQLPFTTMITTDDLALKDYVHFTTESYQIIGQRFAKTYLDLLLAESTADLRSDGAK